MENYSSIERPCMLETMWFPKSPVYSDLKGVLDFIQSLNKAKDMEEIILGW